MSKKFVSWNVNGLRACVTKGFEETFKRLDADFFCLQETKMQAGQLDLTFEGYRSFWNYAEKKGYSGTAIYTRHEPLNVVYGIGIEQHDHEGRTITLEYEDFFLGLKASTFCLNGRIDNLRHIGFIAQEVEKTRISCGIDKNDLALLEYCKKNIRGSDGDLSDNYYGIRYGEFIPLCVHMIQKLYQRISYLETKLIKE